MANIIQSVSDGKSYSTDEEVIGKWIDGSTLYRKIIEITNITANPTIYNFDNIKYMVREYGYLVGKSTTNRTFPMPSTAEEWIACIDEYDSTKIKFHFGANIRNAITGAVVVIEYTKNE